MTSSDIASKIMTVVAIHVVAFGFMWMKKKSDAKKKEGTEVSISLPDWAMEYYKTFENVTFTSEEEMMKVAIEMSRRNVQENTGGPFGTAIYEVDPATNVATLFSVGCNRVVPLHNSTLHGEMVAIQFAQQKLKTFSLAKAESESTKEYHLYTSCEPCAMCLGGTLWSGVSKMVCSATKNDAEAIGFNEGPVFPESYAALEAAGVKVVRNVLAKEGGEVLRKYGETGVIYNR